MENHSLVLSVIFFCFIILFVSNILFSKFLPKHLQTTMYTLLSSSLFIGLMIYSYTRLKKLLIIDIAIASSGSEGAFIDLSNPMTICMSFMLYYLGLYIHTIILTVLVFLATYVLHVLITTLCTRAIDLDFKKSLYYIPWILYGWVEVLCLLLIGGKLHQHSDFVFNWVAFLKDSLQLFDIFKLVSIVHVSSHYVPFVIGLLLTIMYCIYMSFWNFMITKEEKEEFQKNFNHGFLVVTSVVVMIYIIQTFRSVFDEINIASFIESLNMKTASQNQGT